MLNMIKNKLKKFKAYLTNMVRSYARESYAQEGEDILLAEHFQGLQKGFFVDVGAHHPRRFSNTYLLYRKGWRGLNIDPMPGVKALFDKIRPRDTTIEMGIASQSTTLRYAMFDEPSLNGFDQELSLHRDKTTPYKIQNYIDVPVRPLAAILGEYLKDGQCIDLLTVDVEGLDLDVLQSNDWSRYVPSIVVAELRCDEVYQITADPIYKFLLDKNYYICSWTGRSCIFKHRDAKI